MLVTLAGVLQALAPVKDVPARYGPAPYPVPWILSFDPVAIRKCAVPWPGPD